MGALIGLCLGAGALLVFSAYVVPRDRPSRGRRGARGLPGWLHEAGLDSVRPTSLVALCVVAAGTGGLLLAWASHTAPVAVVFAILSGWAPIGVVRARARRRLREHAEVWPEAVDNLASAVRAGMSLPEAVAGLGRRGPEPLRPSFAAFAVDYQLSGRFGESLDRLKDRLADPVADQVVEALRVAREVGGGDLGRLLRTLSGYLRDDARTRSELESRQAWTVHGARLAVAAPWLVLLVLCFQPEVIHRYSSLAGVIVLAGGAIACVVAYRLMTRIGRLPTARRVLS